MRDGIDLRPCSAQSWHRPSIISGAMNTRWRLCHHLSSHCVPSASTHYKTFRCCVFCRFPIPSTLPNPLIHFVQVSEVTSLISSQWWNVTYYPYTEVRKYKFFFFTSRNPGLERGEVLPVCVFLIRFVFESSIHIEKLWIVLRHSEKGTVGNTGSLLWKMRWMQAENDISA
jgi:hypothetical protein